MSTRVYTDGVLTELWDDAAHTYTDFRTDPPTSRPYTPEETASGDAWAAVNTQVANEASIRDALDAALATLQAIVDDTNANINTNPAQRIKDLARTQRRLIRLQLRRLDGTS